MQEEEVELVETQAQALFLEEQGDLVAAELVVLFQITLAHLELQILVAEVVEVLLVPLQVLQGKVDQVAQE
tara:strand:- start:38 stop:250 length:213 start_codon:yes stop_codon:yes gene_type:complete